MKRVSEETRSLRRCRPVARAVAALLAAGLLLAAPAYSQSSLGSLQPQTGAKVFDALVLRPLGFLAVAVGAVAFLPAALLSSPMGRDGIDDAWEHFVEFPSSQTFDRPLGDF